VRALTPMGTRIQTNLVFVSLDPGSHGRESAHLLAQLRFSERNCELANGQQNN